LEAGLASATAARLQTQLREAHRIAADVNHGDGIALLSVWKDLVCWTDGHLCWWWTGRTSRRNRRIYTYAQVGDIVTVACRIAQRYDEVRAAELPPLSFTLDHAVI
jgi:hypothetical protein